MPDQQVCQLKWHGNKKDVITLKHNKDHDILVQKIDDESWPFDCPSNDFLVEASGTTVVLKSETGEHYYFTQGCEDGLRARKSRKRRKTKTRAMAMSGSGTTVYDTNPKTVIID